VEGTTPHSILPLLQLPGIAGYLPFLIFFSFLLCFCAALFPSLRRKIKWILLLLLVCCLLTDLVYYYVMVTNNDLPGIGLYLNLLAVTILSIFLFSEKNACAKTSEINQETQHKNSWWLKQSRRWRMAAFLVAGCIMLTWLAWPKNSGLRFIKNNPGFRYTLVKEWPGLPQGFHLGAPAGLALDSSGHLFVFHRGPRHWSLLMPETLITGPTILELDSRTGQVINQWGAGLFTMPHGLTIDRNNNVWVTDAGLHQVFKFSHEGKLLMQLGTAGVAGKDSLHFNQPTDLAVAADGSIYICDGYGNSRVMKFSAEGKFLFAWGEKGIKPGQFNIPHSIVLDNKGLVYVADRENDRIQVFDTQGKFLRQWKSNADARLFALAFDSSRNQLFASEDITRFIFFPKGSDLFLFNQDTSFLPYKLNEPDEELVCRYHDLAVDREGNIYAGDILGNRILKFAKLRAHP
jgi:DNA-binding beta-propeller fold protein YncE